ncbi:MAG: hypothetical protein WA510_12660 [Acidobacteriaceae bacterium]
MAEEQDDEIRRMLKKILSPAEAQSLVLPPPDHAPASGPGESTPLTGNLAKPPSQATPARQSDPLRRGLAGYVAGASADRSSDPLYVKVYSQGQIGYLPKASLDAARKIDSSLKVLAESSPGLSRDTKA